MKRKMFVGSLTLILALLPLGGVAHAQQQSRVVEQTAKIRSEVARRGTGEKSRVKIRMRDGWEITGYISQAGTDKFTVVNKATNQPTEIAYSDVEKVKGPGLSNGAKIGIIAAVGVGTVAIALAVTFHGILR